MRNPYQQFPSYCWYNSMPYFHEARSQSEDSTERLPDNLSNCLKIEELAPDFNLEGVLGGERTEINLSEQRGRWSLVFFYSSDFTFV